MSGNFQRVSREASAAVAGSKERCIISKWQLPAGAGREEAVFLSSDASQQLLQACSLLWYRSWHVCPRGFRPHSWIGFNDCAPYFPSIELFS